MDFEDAEVEGEVHLPNPNAAKSKIKQEGGSLEEMLVKKNRKVVDELTRLRVSLVLFLPLLFRCSPFVYPGLSRRIVKLHRRAGTTSPDDSVRTGSTEKAERKARDPSASDQQARWRIRREGEIGRYGRSGRI